MGRRMHFHLHTQPRHEIEQTRSWTFMHGHDQPLVEFRRMGAASDSYVLQTDACGSVLRTCSRTGGIDLVYTPYGHVPCTGQQASRLGFNGARYDLLAQAYALGQGYRFYSPALMRFLAPDSLSPFGQGGLNVYGFCANDPVNRSDPSGHAPTPAQLQAQMRAMGLKTVPSSSSPTRPRPVSPKRQGHLQAPRVVRETDFAKPRKSVSINEITQAFSFDKHEAPREIAKNLISARARYNERKSLSKHAGELFEFYLSRQRQYIETMRYSRSSLSIGFQRDPYFARQLAALNQEMIQTRQYLIDVQQAIARLRA